MLAGWHPTGGGRGPHQDSPCWRQEVAAWGTPLLQVICTDRHSLTSAQAGITRHGQRRDSCQPTAHSTMQARRKLLCRLGSHTHLQGRHAISSGHGRAQLIPFELKAFAISGKLKTPAAKCSMGHALDALWTRHAHPGAEKALEACKHLACWACDAQGATSSAGPCLPPCRQTQARPCQAASALQAQGHMVTESVQVAGAPQSGFPAHCKHRPAQ